MSQRQLLTLVFTLIYLSIVVGIIVHSGRKTKTYKDFALGGGKLPWPVLTGTMFATLVGGGTIVGYVGNFKAYGLQWMWLPLIAFIIVCPIGAMAVSPRVRKMNQYTNADLLRIRYGETPQLITAIVIVVAEFACIIGMIGTAGTMIGGYLGLDPEVAMLISVAAFIVTAAFGGLTGVAWTDFVQAVIMFITVFAVAVISVFLLQDNGGFAAVPKDTWNPMTGMHPMLLFGNVLSTSMLSFVSQSTFTQRINAARNDHDAKLVSRWYGLSVGLFIMIGVGLIGICATVLAPDAAGDTVIVAVLDRMPVLVGALYFAAVIAALLTTANSMALSSSVTFTRDILPKISKKKFEDRQLLIIAKVFIVVDVILAYFAVKLNNQVLTWIFINYSLQASIALPMYGGLLSKRATKLSGVLSLIFGSGFVMVWEILKLTKVLTGPIANIHSLIGGILFGAIGFVLGFYSKEKPTEKQLYAVECFRNKQEYIEESVPEQDRV